MSNGSERSEDDVALPEGATVFWSFRRSSGLSSSRSRLLGSVCPIRPSKRWAARKRWRSFSGRAQVTRSTTEPEVNAE
jgi:hypothetical protein